MSNPEAARVVYPRGMVIVGIATMFLALPGFIIGVALLMKARWAPMAALILWAVVIAGWFAMVLGMTAEDQQNLGPALVMSAIGAIIVWPVMRCLVRCQRVIRAG